MENEIISKLSGVTITVGFLTENQAAFPRQLDTDPATVSL